MNNQTRILFTDLDGTLLNDQKKVTSQTQKAIDNALAAGHKIVITTGRPLASGLTCAKETGLIKEGCYVIAFNGGQIYDPFHKKTIYGKTIPRETARYIFGEAVKRNLHIQGYSDTHVLSLKKSPELLRYVKGTGQPYKIVNTVEEAVPADMYKILAISYDDREGEDRFKEEVVDQLKETVHGFYSNDAYLEIVPQGISKGFAVKWMCQYLGIPIENSVAAGDAENDIEMLKCAGWSVCLKNGMDDVKAITDDITEYTSSEDGVGKYLLKNIL